MRSIRSLAVLAATIAVAAIAFGAESQAAVKNTLVPVAKGTSGFGDFHSDGFGDAQSMRSAFGEPDSARRSKRFDAVCKLRWRKLGIAAELVAFGTQTGNPCRVGVFTQASLTDRRWHTASGVHPGGSKRVAKRAALRKCSRRTCGARGYALELHRTDCAAGRTPGVIAVVPKGSKRVRSLLVRWRSCE